MEAICVARGSLQRWGMGAADVDLGNRLLQSDTLWKVPKHTSKYRTIMQQYTIAIYWSGFVFSYHIVYSPPDLIVWTWLIKVFFDTQLLFLPKSNGRPSCTKLQCFGVPNLRPVPGSEWGEKPRMQLGVQYEGNLRNLAGSQKQSASSYLDHSALSF